MINQPYNVYYDNRTGRVVIQKNNIQHESCKKKINNPFQYKINELTKYANINSPNKVNIDNNILENNVKEPLIQQKYTFENNILQNNVEEPLIQQKYTFDNNILENNVKEPLIQQKYTFDNNIKESNDQQNNIKETNVQQKYTFDNNIENKYNDLLKNDIKIHLEKINILKKTEENEDKPIFFKKNENVSFNKNTNITYGIKKTILSDFNHLYNSSNCIDFRIGINNNDIFDAFYLFPNISEINTKTGTNIINEKKINKYNNNNNIRDSQYFPIDFVACGITIPLKSNNVIYSKIIIKNIFWNIFQSINNNNFKNNELLGIVPEITDFVYKKIKLQINFELHAQVSENVIQKYGNEILPYRNKNIIKKITPANTCLYKVLGFNIDTIDGSNFNNIEINLLQDINIQCALLCIKISVPDDSIRILKGSDKINNKMYGHIPFSQFILNFDYEII